MTRSHRWMSVLFCLSNVAFQVACGGSGHGPKTNPGRHDTASAACLNLLEDMSGAQLDAQALSQRTDVLSQLVLQPGTDCPTTLTTILAKIATTDAATCSNKTTSFSAAVVSERAQILGKADRYRAIVTASCGNRSQQELFLSPPATVGVSGPAPEEVEIIAFDPQKGIYSFWAAEGGRWRFFGDSPDLLAGPGGGQFPDQQRRCANCHTGGGLVMKELEFPWNNWEGATTTPGAAQAITNLGQSVGQSLSTFTGLNLGDTLVPNGNAVWETTRVHLMQQNGTVEDLLRPLFCTVEMNLATASNRPGGPSSLPGKLFVDPQLTVGSSVSISGYADALARAGQSIQDGQGNPLSDISGKPVHDTFFGLIFPERSQADRAYVTALEIAGVINSDFTAAVLGTDLTRPVFSQARCDLLKMAPTLDPANRTVSAIHDGFVANLMAANPPSGGAAAELLANLQKQGNPPAKRASAFVTACSKRAATDSANFLNDIMTVVSVARNQLRQLPIDEHSELLPVDNLNTAAGQSTHLDPITCALVH